MDSLKGKVAVITGVSRINSIGYGIAHRLSLLGAGLCIHSFQEYDILMTESASENSSETIIKNLSDNGVHIENLDINFMNTEAPKNLINFAQEKFGHIDILIINHTYDTLKTLEKLNAEEIDRHLFINVRASLLLIQEFARQYNSSSGGRIIILTSGQHLGPMPHPAYVASKGALHHLTWSLSDQLIGKGVTVNAVNPGPTRTYTPDPKIDREVLKKMPQGRWGQPDDAARLVSWLVSDEAQWITGQVIDSEGGFRRG